MTCQIQEFEGQMMQRPKPLQPLRFLGPDGRPSGMVRAVVGLASAAVLKVIHGFFSI